MTRYVVHYQVREHAHDPREAVGLAHVKKFEGLHFETERAVDHEQHQVGHL